MIQVKFLANARDGIIIVDINNQMNNLDVSMNQLEMVCEGQTFKLTDIGVTNYRPAIISHAGVMKFDNVSKTIQVFDSADSLAFSASTDNRKVFVRCDFANKEVTVFEPA